MENTNREKFENLWGNFITLVKGKFISVSKKQTITTPLANLILADVVSSWFSEYEVSGRWLMKFTQENARKADLVKEVLNDMKFSDIEFRKELPNMYDYIIPAVGAGIGFAIGDLCNATKLIQALATVVPAALIYPAVKTFRNKQRVANTQLELNDYIEQLNKYRDSILAILS